MGTLLDIREKLSRNIALILRVLIAVAAIALLAFGLHGARSASATTQSPTCAAPPLGLVSWWPGEGNANDIQGPNNGTLQNGATFAPGLVGQAFQLSGMSYVSIPANTSLDLGTFTLEAWIKPSGTGANGYIAEKEVAGSINYYLLLLPDNRIEFDFFDTAHRTVQSVSSCPANSWCHVAGTYDGSALKVFVNGNLEETLNYVGTPPTGQPLRIGLRYNNTDPFQGQIDELSIYNRALSSTEIQEVFNAGSVGKCETCTPVPSQVVSWWKAEDNANDFFNLNNGTLQNGTTFATGIVGNAFSFDGVDDYVTLPHSTSLNVQTSDFSLEAWVNLRAAPSTRPYFIAGKDGCGEGNIYSLFVLNGNIPAMRLNNSAGTSFFANSGTSISINAWHQLVGVRQGNTLKIFVDGIETGSNTLTGTFGSQTLPFFMGERPLNGDPTCRAKTDGLIDEVALYSRALSVPEIQANFNAGSAGMCAAMPMLTAVLNVNPATVGCGEAIQFDGSASTAAPGRQIINYRWIFDDGSGVIETNQPNTQHTYLQFGQYHPTLVVQDNFGDLSTAAQATVRHLDNNAPTAVIQAPSTINGQAVTFDGSQSSDPDSACGSQIVNWAWRIDSGSPIEGNIATISSSQFAAQLTPGLHTLTLIVVDDSGNESVPASHQLTVGGPPTAALTVNPTTVGCGEVVQFDGNGSAASAGRQIIQYRWDFGDGSAVLQTNQPTTQHSYQQFGLYHPSLVVQDNFGDLSTAAQATVRHLDNRAPTAVIQAPGTIGSSAQTITFDGSQSTDPDGACGGQVITWTWRIDLGSPIQTNNPTISSSQFAAQLTPGVHTLTLIVMDGSGNQSAPATHQLVVQGGTLELTIDIEPDSDVQFTLSGPPPIDSILLDGSAATLLPATKTLDLPAGTYPVIQQQITGFGLVQLTCIDPDNGSSVDLETRTATIRLEIGETVRCTFTSINVSTPEVAATALKSLQYSPGDTALLMKQLGFTATQVAAGLQNAFAISATLIAQSLKDAQYSAEQIAAALKVALNLGAAEVATILKGLQFSATVAAAALNLAFTMTVAEIAQALKTAQYSAEQIAAALKVAFNLGAAEVATILKGLQFSATVTAAALNVAFVLTTTQIAQSLKTAQYTATEIATALQTSFNLGVSAVAQILRDIQFSATEIAIALKNSLNQSAAQVTAILKSLQYSATEVAVALKDAFNFTAAVIAQALKDAQYSAEQIAAALKGAFNLGAAEVATILKGLQFSATVTAAALNVAFVMTATQIAQALKDAQYSAEQIAAALKGALNLGAAGVATILKGLEFSATVTAAALNAAFVLTATQIAQALKTAQYTATEIASALQTSFNLGVSAVAQILRDIQFSATEIAIALKNGLNQTGNQVAAILKSLQFTATQVAIALKDTFSLTVSQVVQLLKDAQFTAAQIAEAMRDALNQTASQIAIALKNALNQTAAQVTTILKGLQYSATEVAQALKDAFNFTAAVIAQTLKDAQYSAEQIAAALKGAFNLGAAEVATILKGLQFSATVTAAALNAGLGFTIAEIAGALKTAQYATTQITLALKNALAQNEAQAAAILQQIGYGATTIANQLAQQYGLVAAQVAPILYSLQVSGTAAATALNSAFTLTAAQIAQNLKDAQYTSTEITLALKRALNQTAQQTAEILKQLNYGVSTISNRLAEEFGLAAAQVGSILQSLQFSASQISHGLNTAFTISANQIAQILKNLNFSSTEISIALKNELNQSAAQAAQILQQLNYGVSTISARLADVFNVGASTGAQILKDLGATSTEIATALKNDFSRSAKQTAQILADLGYSATTVGKRLDDVFGKGASAAAAILKDVGYSANSIATAMKDAFNKSATQTVTILKDLNYSINTLVRVLDQVFNKGVTSIQSILVDIGFSLTEVLDAIRAVLGV